MLGEKTGKLELTEDKFGIQRMEQSLLDFLYGNALLTTISDRLVNCFTDNSVRTFSNNANARELTRRNFKLTLRLACLASTLLLCTAIAAVVATTITEE